MDKTEQERVDLKQIAEGRLLRAGDLVFRNGGHGVDGNELSLALAEAQVHSNLAIAAELKSIGDILYRDLEERKGYNAKGNR